MIKLSVIIFLAIGCISATRGTNENSLSAESDFLKWMLKHEKFYRDINEYKQKFQIFVENSKLVEELNTAYAGKTEFKLNSFADMTESEFRSKVLMKQRKNPLENHPTREYDEEKLEDLPESFDWRTKGAVTPIKDQGGAGTCWAFSTAQNLEGQYFLKGNKLTNVSIEQIVECDGMKDNSTGEADCGVYGGWPFLALQYVKNAGGIASEEKYPYCVGVDKNPCSPCGAPGYDSHLCGPPIPYCYLRDSCEAKFDPSKFIPNLKVVSWERIDTNETVIAQQLLELGPLSIALNAEKLQFYHKGIFDPKRCDPSQLDHAVLLVGWGVEQNKPYWIVKNSWGTKWGESGYFRIARGIGKCGVNTQVVNAILA